MSLLISRVSHISLCAVSQRQYQEQIPVMSFADTEPPPAKKRRFFVEPSPTKESFKTVTTTVAENPVDTQQVIETVSDGRAGLPGQDEGSQSLGQQANGLDIGVLEGIIGDKLDAEVASSLWAAAGGDAERGACECLSTW